MRESFFKDKNLLLQMQILSFKNRTQDEELDSFRHDFVLQGSKREVTKVVPLCKTAKIHGCVPIRARSYQDLNYLDLFLSHRHHYYRHQ